MPCFEEIRERGYMKDRDYAKLKKFGAIIWEDKKYYWVKTAILRARNLREVIIFLKQNNIKPAILQFVRRGMGGGDNRYYMVFVDNKPVKRHLIC